MATILQYGMLKMMLGKKLYTKYIYTIYMIYVDGRKVKEGKIVPAHGPTPSMPRKGNVSFSDVVSPEITNVYVYPEAFSVIMGTTNVYFTLSEPSTVKLKIYDNQETIIREITEVYLPGQNIVLWDGKNNQDNYVADGWYQCRLIAEDLSGNKSEEKVSGVSFDMTPPKIKISTTTEAFSSVLGQSVTFMFLITENLTTINDVNLSIYDKDNNLIITLYEQERNVSAIKEVYLNGQDSKKCERDTKMKKETGPLKEKFKETNRFGETLHKKLYLKIIPKN